MLFPVRQGVLGSCWDFGLFLSSETVPKQHLLDWHLQGRRLTWDLACWRDLCWSDCTLIYSQGAFLLAETMPFCCNEASVVPVEEHSLDDVESKGGCGHRRRCWISALK